MSTNADDITIRFAKLDDVDRIMTAIEKYWDSEHILAHNRDYFLYMFTGDENTINMIIAEDNITHEIIGFRGFIRYSFIDITGAFWFVVPYKRGIVGIELFLFEKAHAGYQGYLGIGANPNTAVPIYRRLGWSTGKLDHYYRISNQKEYKIAKITDQRIIPFAEAKYVYDIIKDFDTFRTVYTTLPIHEQRPYRDIKYFKWRFFDHPYFCYKVYGIYSKDKKTPNGFFICREVHQNNAKALRIVDYTGPENYFADASSFLQKLMAENSYEYIDCYCYGMSESTMNGAGLLKRTAEDRNIIPNYFEPFLRENVDIYYVFNKVENVRLFRGDSDQDCPRLYSSNEFKSEIDFVVGI
jgi:hypothetical protein